MATLAERIAEWAGQATYESLSPETVHQVRRPALQDGSFTCGGRSSAGGGSPVGGREARFSASFAAFFSRRCRFFHSRSCF
jgi:hypothetical protein